MVHLILRFNICLERGKLKRLCSQFAPSNGGHRESRVMP